MTKLSVCFPAFPCCYRNHKGGHRQSSQLEMWHHNTILTCGYGKIVCLLFRGPIIRINRCAMCCGTCSLKCISFKVIALDVWKSILCFHGLYFFLFQQYLNKKNTPKRVLLIYFKYCNFERYLLDLIWAGTLRNNKDCKFCPLSNCTGSIL